MESKENPLQEIKVEYSDSIPVFYPTWEQFSDFSTFIAAIEPFGSTIGLAKIVPPQKWSAAFGTPSAESLASLTIKSPITQSVCATHMKGSYSVMNLESRKSYSVQAWYELTCKPEYQTPIMQDRINILNIAQETNPHESSRMNLPILSGPRVGCEKSLDFCPENLGQNGSLSSADRLVDHHLSLVDPLVDKQFSMNSLGQPLVNPDCNVVSPISKNNSTNENLLADDVENIHLSHDDALNLLSVGIPNDKETRLNSYEKPISKTDVDMAVGNIRGPYSLKTNETSIKKLKVDMPQSSLTLQDKEILVDNSAQTLNLQDVFPENNHDSKANQESVRCEDSTSLSTLGITVNENDTTKDAVAVFGTFSASVTGSYDYELKNDPSLNNHETQCPHTDNNLLSTPLKNTLLDSPKPKQKPISASKRKRQNKPITFDIHNLPVFTPEYCHELERNYWRNLTYVPAIYGADMMGTLFDAKKKNPWNVDKLDNLLTRIPASVPGVNKAYLYFGMWKATFAWHVEDMDLFSINYIHFGAPKQWYVVPTAQKQRFEGFARGIFHDDAKYCTEFLRHKTCLISPSVLSSAGITVHKVVQYSGEVFGFMITFPNGYHAGYNLGFNCAESVNFAMESWIKIGRQAKFCKCVKDSVKLDVRGIFGDDESFDYTLYENMRDTRKCALCPGLDKTLLVKTDQENEWVHHVCAYYVPETYFTINPENANDITVQGVKTISRDRWNLKCQFCRDLYKRPKNERPIGAAIQYARGKCTRAYHVTCAKLNGILLTDDGLCYCPQHAKPVYDEILQTD